MAYIKAALIAALKVILKRRGGGGVFVLRYCDFSHRTASKEKVTLVQRFKRNFKSTCRYSTRNKDYIFLLGINQYSFFKADTDYESRRLITFI